MPPCGIIATLPTADTVVHEPQSLSQTTHRSVSPLGKSHIYNILTVATRAELVMAGALLSWGELSQIPDERS